MKLTASRVAQKLDISVATLNNWYKWYHNAEFVKPEGMPDLPEYEQQNPRGPRYWETDDLKALKAFKKWLPKGRGGVMGELNAKYWGERGQRALKNKNTLKTEE